MLPVPRYKTIFIGIATAAVLAWAAHGVPCQETEWVPTAGTHAWARFGPKAWKEVRVRTYSYDDQGQVQRSSTTIARTRVVSVGLRSFSLCVSSTLEVAGHEFPRQTQDFERDLAPEVESTQTIGEETITVDGKEYPTKVISLITKSGTRRETSTLYHCDTTYPQTLKRVTTTVDAQSPDAITETTVTVTQMNRMADILGELKCTWSVTTVIKQRDRTVTIREVNCRDVPGELVSQVSEEHDADGKRIDRKELELVGYGQGRLRRLFRRR